MSGEALFLLIKTMSKNEKSNFKKLSKRQVINEKTKYLQIFDGIDQMKAYDESKINAIDGYPHFKTYLYNAILRSLRIYRQSQSGKIEFQELWIDTDILMEKGLWKQAYRRLKQARKVALKYHLDNLLIELNYLERRIFRQLINNKNSTRKKIKELQKENQQLLIDLKEDLELLDLYEDVYHIIYHEKDAAIKIDINMENSLEGLKKPVKSFNGQVCYYLTKSWYAGIKKDYESRSKYMLALVKIFESLENKEALEKNYDFQARYIGVLNNYAMSLFDLKTIKNIPKIVKKIDAINASTTKLKAQIFQTGMQIQIVYFLKTKQYNKVILAESQLLEGLENYKSILSAKVMFTFFENLAMAFLLVKNTNMALDYINKLINMPEPELGRATLMSAYMMAVMAFYSRKEFEVAQYRISKFKRKFENYETSHQFQVVDTIGKAIESKSKMPLQGLLTLIDEELVKEWVYIQ